MGYLALPEYVWSALFHGPEVGNGSLWQLYRDVSDSDTTRVGDERRNIVPGEAFKKGNQCGNLCVGEM